jgi:hypothetical protein
MQIQHRMTQTNPHFQNRQTSNTNAIYGFPYPRRSEAKTSGLSLFTVVLYTKFMSLIHVRGNRMKSYVRILVFLIFLFFSATVANATNITVQSSVIPNWRNTTTSVFLRVTHDAFIDNNGILHPGGANDYQDIALTVDVNAHTLTIPSFTIVSTSDSLDNPNARYRFAIVDSRGRVIQVLDGLDSVTVPPAIASISGCSPQGTCATLADLRLLNGVPNPFPPRFTYTDDVINRMISQNNTSGITPIPFITTVPSGTLSNEFAISSLGSGLLFHNGSGNLIIASAGSHYEAPFSASSPLVKSGGVLSLPAADSGHNGYLTAANWSLFASKENALTFNAPFSRVGATISLSPSGVTAGSYVNPSITVDTFGRVTAAATNALSPGPTTWGLIGGDILNQPDLQTALGLKVPTSRTINGHNLASNFSLTKSDLGLGNVENTALSTWAGSTNLTTFSPNVPLLNAATNTFAGTGVFNKGTFNYSIGIGTFADTNELVNMHIDNVPAIFQNAFDVRNHWPIAPSFLTQIDLQAFLEGGTPPAYAQGIYQSLVIAMPGTFDATTGISGSVVNNNTATLSIAGGIGASLVNNSSGNIIDGTVFSGHFNTSGGAHTAIALQRLKSFQSAGSVTDFRGLDFSNWVKTGGTVGTSYVIYADDTTRVGSTNYFIYSLTTSPSLFSGDVTIAGLLKAGSSSTTLTNASGQVIDSAILSASTWNAKVGGSGSVGTLPYFSAASTLSDSLLSQSGSVVTANGFFNIGTPSSNTAYYNVIKTNQTPASEQQGFSATLSNTNNTNVRGVSITASQASTSGTTSGVNGAVLTSSNTSTGTVSNLVGLNFSIGNSGGGVATNSVGMSATVVNSNSSTMTSGKGIGIILANIGAASSMPTAKGISVDGWVNTGTVTTSYGLYMDNSIGIGTTNYGIYVDATSQNFFRGNITTAGILTTGSASTVLTNADGTLKDIVTTFTDVTTGNSTTSNHGYLRKLSGSSSDVLRGDGTWGSAGVTSVTGTSPIVSSGGSTPAISFNFAVANTFTNTQGITIADSAALNLRSGGSGNFVALTVGRTGSDLDIGVAGATNQFVTGTGSGDAAIRVGASNALYFGSLSGGTAWAKITSSGLFGTAQITGAASNMVITSGTGNSRTLTVQTTTSGGTPTNVVVFGADQSAAFAGAVTAGSITSSTIQASTNLFASTNLYIGSGVGAVKITNPTTGVLSLDTFTTGSFNRINFGGNSSSFPSIKLNGTGIDFRLANDSDYAPIAVSNLVLSGKVGSYAGATPTNGQFLIGHTANGTFEKATLTASNGIAITNGAGSVTIASTGEIKLAEVTGVSLASISPVNLYGPIASGKTVVVTRVLVINETGDASDGNYGFGWDSGGTNVGSGYVGPANGQALTLTFDSSISGLPIPYGVATDRFKIATTSTPSDISATARVLVFGYIY